MTPVEATSTPSAGMPSAFETAAALFAQASMPSAPVQAFATPLLITTACEGIPPYTTF